MRAGRKALAELAARDAAAFSQLVELAKSALKAKGVPVKA